MMGHLEMLNVPRDIVRLPNLDTNGEWKPFWDGTTRGELMIQYCLACASYQFYPRPLCGTCGGEPELIKASGTGEIYSFSIVRQNLVEPFQGMVPYVVALITLAEGPRMMSNVVGCQLGEVRIGMPVEVMMAKARNDLFIPYWKPRAL